MMKPCQTFVTAAAYRSDGESSDEEDDGQEIPAWAQDANLRREIARQQKLDPDELFQQNEKTCPLEEVFASLRNGTSLATYTIPSLCSMAQISLKSTFSIILYRKECLLPTK